MTPVPGPGSQGCPCLQGNYLILDVDQLHQLIVQLSATPNFLTIITCIITSVMACLATPSSDVLAKIQRALRESGTG